jgi:hypothetical protein
MGKLYDAVYKAAADGKIPEFDKTVHNLGVTGDADENAARATEAANQVTGTGPTKNPQNFASQNRGVTTVGSSPSGLGNDHSPVTFTRVDGGEG